MKFVKKSKVGALEKYIFEKESDLGSISTALCFFFRKDASLFGIEFYSKIFGIANWYKDDNRFVGKSWEAEETAQSVSALNYHYTGKFLSASASEELIQKILTNVLESSNSKIIELAKTAMAGEVLALEKVTNCI
ncbi:MAG: hypothetical protein SFU98_08375 [Leptospiraceae bacterium]|nr:hypothetical protein [Leptospiraceae bacterium]